MEPAEPQSPTPIRVSRSLPRIPSAALPPIDLGQWHDRERAELVLVYLGGPSCGFCRDPVYQQLLLQFKDVMATLARERKVRLRVIGVSDDWDVAAGIEFLRGIGPWDEIVVGNNMYNSAVIEHVWNQEGATAGVPQVVLFERRFKLGARKLEITSKHYILRLRGKRELQHWLESALPPGT